MTPQVQSKTALIVGASGGVGGALARALVARGWRVRGLSRDPARARAAAPDLAGLDWRAGDALDPASVLAAAQGCAVIAHCANPAGYHDWAGTVLPMLEGSIAAARATGARLLFPGAIYNFHPDDGPVLDEAAPQRPATRKGALRVAMERRLQAAAAEGAPVLIVRAGDFFGPSRGNTWFAQGLMAAGPGLVLNPGQPGVGHAWAYLPDLAEAMVRLLEQEGALEPFARFHFAGHWDPDGRQMARAVRRALGGRAPILPFPWLVTRLLAPFVEVFREMGEMTYLWRRPLRLDNAALVAAIGPEPHTPLDEAVAASLAGLGMTPKAKAAAPMLRIA